jgi:HPt (histidine-containing phosphotransfer) domain-containing protein
MADEALDAATVQGLHELGQMTSDGDERIRHLVRTYIADARDRVTRVSTAVAAADAAEMRSVAHSLVGSSANLGARRVAEVSREIEIVARTGDLEAGPALVERLESALADAIVALRLEFALCEDDDHSR